MVSRQILSLFACCCCLAWPWGNPAAAQQTLPAQLPNGNGDGNAKANASGIGNASGNGLDITIDDLAGPNGPGPAKSKGNHWKVEPGYGWWGPGYGYGFDDGFLY